LTKSYFQGCLGVLLLFSLTDLESFKNIEKWLEQLDEHTDGKLVKILIGTKVDSPDQRVV
jgi:GTPase SAR1 family protein